MKQFVSRLFFATCWLVLIICFGVAIAYFVSPVSVERERGFMWLYGGSTGAAILAWLGAHFAPEID